VAKKSEKKSERMSLRQYAEHRGVRLSAVQKAIKTGRIAPGPDGKIDAEVADLSWLAATDPSKQRKTIKAKRIQKHAERFAEARASSEDYKSKLSQIKFEQQCGKLVDADVVRKRYFESSRSLREALLNLPNQIANDLASETDPVKVANMLTIELTNLLEEQAGPRVSAAEAGLSSLGSDPASPSRAGTGNDGQEPDPEDDGAEDDELEGLPVEAPR
jgi:hypothetical protein